MYIDNTLFFFRLWLKRASRDYQRYWDTYLAGAPNSDCDKIALEALLAMAED